MSTYNGYSSTLSSTRLSSYTPKHYTGSSFSSTSSYLYKPPLPTSSYRSTLPRSYLSSNYYPGISSTTSTRKLSNTYYPSSVNNVTNLGSSYLTKSSTNISTLGSNYRTSAATSTNAFGTSYYPGSSYESPSRRNSTTDSISSRLTDGKKKEFVTTLSYRRLDEERDEPQRAGITNLGNTCFMNAILQCLCHTEPLVEYCLTETYRKDINFLSPTRGDLINVFAEFVQKLSESKSTVSPHRLRAEVQKYAPNFEGNCQQDAQEFLRYLMQGLHDDIKRVSHSYGDPWRKFHDADDSLIVDLFSGQLKSTLQCSNCKSESVTYDPFWDLSLPIPEGCMKTNLRACFSMFSRPEVLDEQNKAFCDNCMKKNRASKKIQVYKFPKVLVIHLKRSSGYSKKCTTMVECPLVLKDLSEFSSRNGFRDYASYELYGVVDHIGTGSSGHYVARCRDPVTKEWKEFNDSRVSKPKDIVTSNTYMLFYIQ